MQKDLTAMQDYLNKLNQFVIKLNNPQFLYKNLQGDLFSGFQNEYECNIN